MANKKSPAPSSSADDYFLDTIGQPALKTELYQAYVGAMRVGEPIPHGLLIGPPGYGKTAKFVPGIARMTGFEMIPPVSISGNMQLDKLFLGPNGISLQTALIQAQGGKPLIVLEELSNIGKPNTGRLLTLLSEGFFTSLAGDNWELGTPGVDWCMIAACNDDGRFLAALNSRFDFFRFDEYTTAELAEIGYRYALGRGSTLDMDELMTVAKTVESPRDMINKVRRMRVLEGVNIAANALELRRSLRLDEDDLHADLRRTLIALFDLGGKAPQSVLAKKVRVRLATLSGWLGDLAQKGFVNIGAGSSGGTSLTEVGKAKAAHLKTRGYE